MNFKPSLGIAFGLCFVACAESIPNRTHTNDKPADKAKTFHPNPIRVSLHDLDEDDYSDVLSVTGSVAILLSESSADYDSAVTRRNRRVSVRSSGPGADALWFTEDDDIQSLTEDIIGPDGSEHWIMYIDVGADGDWTTLEDNTVGNFASTLFNADNLETKHIFYANVGLDLLPFTEDDIPSYYHSYTHNAANLESNKLRYNGPGVDAIWLTADDDIEECEETTFTRDNLVEQEVDTHAGADYLCFTGDDVIVGYNAYTHDATGHLTDEHRFTDPGPDLHWHTDDDLLSREYIFTPI